MVHSSTFRTCLFCHIDIIAYCGSAPANASWKMDTCPSAAAGAPLIPCTHPAGCNDYICSWWRDVRSRSCSFTLVTLTPSLPQEASPEGDSRGCRNVFARRSSQSTGRWQPSHTTGVGRQTAAYIGALRHWTYTRSRGKDNIQRRIHTPAVPKKEMTKMTAARAFSLWEVTLPEDTGCRKLSVGIYRGILMSFLEGEIALFLQKLSEMIACVTIASSLRL